MAVEMEELCTIVNGKEKQCRKTNWEEKWRHRAVPPQLPKIYQKAQKKEGTTKSEAKLVF